MKTELDAINRIARRMNAGGITPPADFAKIVRLCKKHGLDLEHVVAFAK